MGDIKPSVTSDIMKATRGSYGLLYGLLHLLLGTVHNQDTLVLIGCHGSILKIDGEWRSTCRQVNSRAEYEELVRNGASAC